LSARAGCRTSATAEDLDTYLYDAEDRLIKITSAAGGTASKEIRYDYLHRRVEEKDFAGGANPVKWQRFVWQGWMLIAEIDVNVSDQSKTVSQTFTWEPDLSGTIHSAAGIGGLLLVDKSSTQQFVAGDDGRGNVTVLLDALNTGTPSANLKTGIEYAPYGEIVRSTGDLSLLPFRFQTKWALGQYWQGSLAPEHLDFGRRVYLPRFGRFLNRDPLGEGGGANLYHYCGNDPINRMDPLGLQTAVSGWYLPKDIRLFFGDPETLEKTVVVGYYGLPEPHVVAELYRVGSVGGGGGDVPPIVENAVGGMAPG
jgi:RHS repeat-associated protein